MRDLERLGRLGMDYEVVELARHPRRLRRYLDCVEELRGRPIRGLSLDEAWLVNLLQSGTTCLPAVVLTLLRRTHAGTATAQQPAALVALGRDLQATGPLAEQARALARAL